MLTRMTIFLVSGSVGADKTLMGLMSGFRNPVLAFEGLPWRGRTTGRPEFNC